VKSKNILHLKSVFCFQWVGENEICGDYTFVRTKTVFNFNVLKEFSINVTPKADRQSYVLVLLHEQKIGLKTLLL